MSKKKVKNAQIIAAATAELTNKGLDAASMHNIAEMAKVSKRTLYKYYPTKEDLYSALIDEILDRMEDMYSFEYDSDLSVKTQIENVISSKVDLMLTDSFLKINRIVVGELLKSRRPTEEQLDRLNKSEAMFVQWIIQGQKDGKIIKDLLAENIASQFHSILKGQIYWPILLGLKDKKDIDLESIKKITLDFFINGFCLTD